MKIAISQPTYLPWIGYFDLMDQVDVFVLLDSVQFEKQSWQQRNRIKTPIGLQWVTVPVHFHGRFGQLIRDVEIRDADFWVKHWRAIELNYARARFFTKYSGDLDHRVREYDRKYLANLNIEIIQWCADALGIKTILVRSSTLQHAGKRTELLANICEGFGATQYVSPLGSAVYLLEEKNIFAAHGIDVVFQHYEHPEYRQLFPPFLPYASALDLIFNEGDGAYEIMRKGRRSPFTPEEVANTFSQAQTG